MRRKLVNLILLTSICSLPSARWALIVAAAQSSQTKAAQSSASKKKHPVNPDNTAGARGPGENGAGAKRAVLIAINTYVSKGAGAATDNDHRGNRIIDNLDGALNDLESIYQVLVAVYKFKPEDIHVFTAVADAAKLQADGIGVAGGASHDEILAAIEKYLIDPAKPNDTEFFYFAGHGSRVRNSKSNKPDKYDETIVPADAYQPNVWDVRDKEISRKFSRVLDKGAVLTAVFDSCHSGAIARGISRFSKIRYVDPDEHDAADPPDPGPTPEERGALIFSAAQDTESAAEIIDEKGVPHGAFTAALLKVLSTRPIDESAEDIFKQTKTTMQYARALQEPVLAGTAARRRVPLLGSGTAALSNKITLAVRSVSATGVQLLGGSALGFGEGSELVPATKQAETKVRLRVATQTIGESDATPISGDIKTIQPGDLFVLDRWVPSSLALLPVWLPPDNLPLAELQGIANTVVQLRKESKTGLVDDPLKDLPRVIVSWNGASWTLTDQTTSRTQDLGRKLDAAAIKHLASGTGRVFVDFPPPAGVTLHSDESGAPVRLVESPRQATYLLVGRAGASGLEYAWVLPDSSAPAESGSAESEQATAMPSRSRWDSLTEGDAGKLSRVLMEDATKLGKIFAWLNLSSPRQQTYFPYHLAVTKGDQGAIIPENVIKDDGSLYDLALIAEPSQLQRYIEPRWVYVFAIDRDGKGTLLFPRPQFGNVQNRFPTADQVGLPTRIQLAAPFRVQPPYGIDTYILLTTADPIDPLALNFEGIGGETRGLGRKPLEQLLSRVGTRGTAVATPESWSITRIPMRSVKGQ